MIQGRMAAREFTGSQFPAYIQGLVDKQDSRTLENEIKATERSLFHLMSIKESGIGNIQDDMRNYDLTEKALKQYKAALALVEKKRGVCFH